MVMYPLHISFSAYSIIGLALFILSGSMAVQLLRIKSKSQVTRSLTLFFIMVMLSGGAMILTNAIFHYDRLFDPWQDFWILAGGVALVRMAYNVPGYERPREAKTVLVIMSSLAALALAYCLSFNYRYLFDWTPGLDASDVYYLLLPIGTLFIVIIFLRRSLYFSTHFEATTGHREPGNIWRYLLDPQGESARTFRNLALALSLAFLPGLQTLFHFPYPLGFVLSNMGSLAAIIAIALVYLNYAPEVESFMAKLVGITLSTLLLIITIYGALDIYSAQFNFSAERWRTVAFIHDALISTGELPGDPFNVTYVVSWDAGDSGDATAYQQIYLSEGETGFDLSRLIDENHDGYVETWSQPVTRILAQLANDDLRFIRRYWTYPLGSSQDDYQSFIFFKEGKAYEIGFSSTVIDEQVSSVVSKWLVAIILSCAFVLLVFPLFFHRTLVKPLGNLLEGIRRVDQGELDTVILPSFNDEIGTLTQSFNRMVSSLKKTTSTLENWGLDLEREVSQRTIDLVNMNVRLEKEVENREMAEARLNQQLLYQQALAGCSQSLLVAVENESNQKEALNQALEHLRSGAQTSRAYVFHKFDDPEMGSCIGMLAEVCAPGIPAHLDNPVNQKFPLSQLPTDFVAELTKGNPYGGLVKEEFVSTPVLQEAFLSQRPPLLSVMFFPVFDRDRLWGFIGFDDCITERDWDSQEISILRTASEMVGNTLQRWEIETQLRETFDELEIRVQERTAELGQSNIKLYEEIQQRQLAQNDLESRLKVEEILANISTRLLEPTKIRENIEVSLEDLARIMKAGRIFLAEFDLQATNQVRDYIEWHRPETLPLSEEVVQDFVNSLIRLQERLRNNEIIYIEDIEKLSKNIEIDLHSIQEHNVQSLVLSPIIVNQRVQAVLGCSNLQSSADTVQMNLSALELVASMLKSLLQREYLIQTLEEQVAERTHQLTTFLDMAMLSDQAQDLADMLQPTLLSITQIASCDACGIHIINEKKSSLELIAQRGIPLEFLHPLREIELNAEFVAWLKEADPHEVLSELKRGPVFPEPFCFPGYYAFFANRLKTGSKSLGLLSCYRIEDRPFSPFQATLLSALGELLGIIMENHRLKSEAEELAAVEERQRLAREIHDAVSQSVYSLSLFARSAKDALDESNEGKLLSNLQDIEATAVQAMREMRLLLYQLREAGQDTDVATALDARFKQVESRLGIQATCEIGADIILPAPIQHEIWRILIEALNNAVKHASASHVRVQITYLDEYLFVFIQDDGIGFDITHHSPGMGLKNIQARADTLGGQLEIISELGQGTKVSLKVPMTSIDSEEGDQKWQRPISGF